MSAAAPEFRHEFRPARAGGAPTLLLLHGTGGDEHDLLPLGRSLDSSAALLSPRGQREEQGGGQGMPRWFRRRAEGVFDTDDLVARTHELADFVLAAADRYERDPSTLIAVGFSNGANIAAAMLLLRPEVLRAAILLSPMFPLEDPRRVDLSRVGVFIGAGRADPIAPPDHAERLAGLLTDCGAGVEMYWHPAGHGVDNSVLAAGRAWLGKLRAASATDPLP